MKPKVAVNGSVCRFVFSSDTRYFTKEHPPLCPPSVAYWGIFTDIIKFPDEHKWANTSRLKCDNVEDGIILVFDVWILSIIMNTICFHSADAHSSHRQRIWPEGCQIRSGISHFLLYPSKWHSFLQRSVTLAALYATFQWKEQSN